MFYNLHQDKLSSARNKVVDVFKNMNVGNIQLPDITPQNYFEANTKVEDIKNHLEGDSDKDKMDSMKKLIAVSTISQSPDFMLVSKIYVNLDDIQRKRCVCCFSLCCEERNLQKY